MSDEQTFRNRLGEQQPDPLAHIPRLKLPDWQRDIHIAVEQLLEQGCQGMVPYGRAIEAAIRAMTPYVALAEARRLHALGATHECSEWPTSAGECAVCGKALS